MQDFDVVLRKGFEKLIGIELEDKWRRLAQLPPKYGGMGLRSGLKTYGAQHLCSLAKSADNVERITGSWDLVSIAHRETGKWLSKATDKPVDIGRITKIVKEVQELGTGCRLPHVWCVVCNCKCSL